MIQASIHIVNPPQGLAKKFRMNMPARPDKDDLLRLRIKIQDRSCGFNLRVNSTWFEGLGDENLSLIVSVSLESFFNPEVEPSAIV
jgi:hypothetical protein